MPRIYSDNPSEGPRTYTVPASNRTTCGACKFHVCTGALCTRVGPGGWREYACSHPDAYEPLPADTDPKVAEMTGRIRALDKSGRQIGRTDATPEWCPYLRSN